MLVGKRRGCREALVPVCLFLAALALGACGRKAVQARTLGPADSKVRVLIAMRNTTFKALLVTRITDDLAKRNVRVDVVDTERVEQVSAARYHVILVMDDFRWWSLAGPVKRFVKRLGAADRGKVLLLTTAGSPNKMKRLPGVDAVSCASKQAQLGTVAARVLVKVRRRLPTP